MNDESRVSAAAFTKYKYFSYLRIPIYVCSKKSHICPACLIIQEASPKKKKTLKLNVCEVEAQKNKIQRWNTYQLGLLKY